MSDATYQWVNTMASMYIDEAERHRELYDDFTPRQRLVLLVWEKSQHSGLRGGDMRTALLEATVTDNEIAWLERTGRLRSSTGIATQRLALKTAAPTRSNVAA
jgi:hypothetical protein